MFPFSSRYLNEKKWRIRLYVVEMVGSIVLCSIAPIIYISVSDYRLTRFPQSATFPSTEVIFYSILIPFAMILAVGINLIVYTFFTIHKVIAL